MIKKQYNCVKCQKNFKAESVAHRSTVCPYCKEAVYVFMEGHPFYVDYKEARK